MPEGEQEAPEEPEAAKDLLAKLAEQAGFQLPDELKEAIRQGNPAGAVAQVFQLQATVGSMPPPAMLAQYEALYPGFTRDTMSMAKSQAEHRQHLERFSLEGNSKRADRGQWFAIVSTVMILGVSAALGFSGHTAAAIGIFGVDIVGVASVFVSGRVGQLRERVAKERLMNEVEPSQKRDR